MTQFFGPSFIFHFLVLIIHGVKKAVRWCLGKRNDKQTTKESVARVISPVMACSIAGVTCISVGLIGFVALNAVIRLGGVVGAFAFSQEKCKQFDVHPHENNNAVVLRLDDVQEYTWGESTQKIINEAMRRQIPISAGVVPSNIENNKDLFNVLYKNRCNIEFVLHGWDHQQIGEEHYAEFELFTQEEASPRIVKGKQKLNQLFEQDIHVFVPPQNIFSEGTQAALEENGFNIISSEGDGVYDYNATTYYYNAQNPEQVNETLEQCEKGFSEYGHCIIMLHPQDVTINHELDIRIFNDFVMLLDRLEEQGVIFTRFVDL